MSDRAKTRMEHLYERRPNVRRANDIQKIFRAMDAIGKDVSPEILNKLKAMETSSRKVGNTAEANAFLEKVHQYEPSYQAGSHNYETLGPNAARQRGQHQQQGSQHSPRPAARSAWEDFMRQAHERSRQRAGKREQEQQQKREARKQPSSSSSERPKTAEKPAAGSGGGRSAAAKKAWETMRAKRAAAKATDSDSVYRQRMHIALDRVIDAVRTTT
jgi:hypothetical protein